MTRSNSDAVPLAERLRPRQLEQIVGQDHILGEGGGLRKTLERGHLRSMLFWGPPGVGKTTLARLIADKFDAYFVAMSAVSAGVKEVRKVATEAAERLENEGQRTILFLDEVHRFNKAQQDSLLPHVEDGTLVFIGATTENPSFEVNGALRSRAQLYVLKVLDDAAVGELLCRAVDHPEGFAGELVLEDDALSALVAWAAGDGRRGLNGLEHAAAYAQNGTVTKETVKTALSARDLALDKGGEHFYNLVSALHKSVRGSDPDAALYWLARLLAGGADLMYIARRLVRIASEDVGLADPNALRLSIAARDAAQFLGQPEGELALAEAAVYLSVAPKSNGLYTAWKAARQDAANHPTAEVPLHLRNAPSGMMKALGYSQGYAYYFDDPKGSFAQAYLPAVLSGRCYYTAQGEGWEVKVRERLKALETERMQARGETKAK